MQAVRAPGEKEFKRFDTPVKVLPKQNLYASDTLGLSFYAEPPQNEVSIAEFQDYTLDRLKVLHTIDRHCGFDTGLGKVEMSDPIKQAMLDARLLLRQPLGNSAAETFLQTKEDYCLRDSISHFALVLVFCKTRDMRQWFLRQEQRLFAFRFETMSAEAKVAFLKDSGLDCTKFDPDKSDDLTLDALQKATPGARIWSGTPGPPEFDQNFYEMPFHLVNPSLISGRRVVLRKGKAYFPSSALKEVLVTRLKEKLTAALDTAFQNLESALQDTSVGDFLRALQMYGPHLLVAPKSSTTEDVGVKLTVANFEEMLHRSFPPCMRRLVENQREKKKHLKHAGRLQLRPFLKDCGFTFEESVSWWQQELSHTAIDAVAFEKDYKYDVEHAYGKKGHFQGQNSFGCPKIISFPAEATGQCHGCPFRHMDMPALKQQLHSWGVSEASMKEIEVLITKGKHYQLACVEYFKAMHPGHDGDGVGNTPKDYFQTSCRVHLKADEKKAGTVAATA
mmetsp:Transcript_70586/g.132089  ORF Transcript_70586/g.132089 Transcript_70586/m.132089 type:complete len:505 (-) Transcript_70586:99-1613(-)